MKSQKLSLFLFMFSLVIFWGCKKSSASGGQEVLDIASVKGSESPIGEDQLLQNTEGQSGGNNSEDLDPIDPEDTQTEQDTLAAEEESEEDAIEIYGEEEVEEDATVPQVAAASAEAEEPETKVFSIDEDEAVKRGEWKYSRVIAGYTNEGYHHSLYDGEKKSVVFKLNQRIEASGFYTVKAHWTAHPNRATNAKIRIVSAKYDDEGELKRTGKTVTVNQRYTQEEGNYIGTYYFHKNVDLDPKHVLNRWQKVRVVANQKSNGYVIADGMTIEWVGATLPDNHMAQESPITLDTTNWEHVRKKGDWKVSTAVAGYDGDFYIHDMNGMSLQSEEERKNVRYAPRFAEAGNYEIYVKFTSHGNRGSPLYVVRSYDAAADKVKRYAIRVDQSTDAGKTEDGWLKLVHSRKGVETSSFYFDQGQSFKHGALVLRRDKHTNGYIIADSVKFVKID
ncbi:hypothetical protein [Pseudobacteriovorax antillogorgiicola]|uniref:Golvesin/Xly CBD-like domain-containing protein n=1 Tax=Pseudobacteriovorax antillogorgiicola TaxID=1513793 RepID=A0A1Y6CP19_9BACT|nr:hypothetical protein [Pseudobacteriovorax antillogorgiicola]TCS43514.1 hypothetical protein EDD56_13642 [Pseudobacteriovorax antillogorgiicola]SMF81071.1 hypothetical protein SAMN06296036_1364 [Pseudobacteriovorax antillogorgiicola]